MNIFPQKQNFQDLLIIIPTYNEASNINNLFKELKKHCKNTNLLFIDDNSDDGTRENVIKQKKKF